MAEPAKNERNVAFIIPTVLAGTYFALCFVFPNSFKTYLKVREPVLKYAGLHLNTEFQSCGN